MAITAKKREELASALVMAAKDFNEAMIKARAAGLTVSVDSYSDGSCWQEDLDKATSEVDPNYIHFLEVSYQMPVVEYPNRIVSEEDE